MDFKERENKLSKSQRMQLKALACILGIVLLLILLVCRLFSAILQWIEPEPVIRNLYNVWIMETGENHLKVFEEGLEKVYECEEGVMIPEEAREQVADIVLSDEKVARVQVKSHKINGKVLAVDSEGIELEGVGKYALTERVKGYRLYDTLTMCTGQDLLIGYDFADFVLEDGKICAILMVKEEVMEYIRVLIKSGDYKATLHDRLTITSDADYTICYESGGQTVEELHKAGEVCEVDENSHWLKEGRIRIVPSVLTGKVILQNVSRNQGIPAYRGTIEVMNTGKGLAVINEVLLEEYLYSVVPSEMPASYPAEALNAQAVCARTYAYKHMLHAGLPEYGAHVDDSTGYQVYNNIAEQEAATTAVKETYGQILFWEEGAAPADTYYYSTSCGVGSDADVWSVESGGSPAYLTSQLINRTEMANFIAGSAGTTAEVAGTTSGAEVVTSEATASEAERTEAPDLTREEDFARFICSKNVDDYEVSESWYRWQYEKESIDSDTICQRLKERYQANPSRILTLQQDGTYKSEDVKGWNHILNLEITERGAGGVAKELLLTTDKETYLIFTEYNIRYILCDGETKVFRQDGSQASAPTLLPSGFFLLETVKEKENVVGYYLTGGGYGHGVGMSQNGARNMAAEGRTAQEILAFFYQGCLLLNVYE
ncbi:MAG: SpoIID/LytB domain-containing protein [Lachnospiraceae bacterium]|nr:SpoIID/LytB domain-containing protein [Lachnospiraceae bacterium]